MTQDNELPLEVDCQTTKRLRDSGADLLLIDCRTQEEYDLVRIEGSQLLPMDQITARVGELEPHRDRHIVVHCHHGGRSLRVTQWLQSQGFTRVQNLTGGIDAWAQEIDPSLPRY